MYSYVSKLNFDPELCQLGIVDNENNSYHLICGSKDEDIEDDINCNDVNKQLYQQWDNNKLKITLIPYTSNDISDHELKDVDFLYNLDLDLLKFAYHHNQDKIRNDIINKFGGKTFYINNISELKQNNIIINYIKQIGQQNDNNKSIKMIAVVIHLKWDQNNHLLHFGLPNNDNDNNNDNPILIGFIWHKKVNDNSSYYNDNSGNDMHTSQVVATSSNKYKLIINDNKQYGLIMNWMILVERHLWINSNYRRFPQNQMFYQSSLIAQYWLDNLLTKDISYNWAKCVLSKKITIIPFYFQAHEITLFHQKKMKIGNHVYIGSRYYILIEKKIRKDDCNYDIRGNPKEEGDTSFVLHDQEDLCCIGIYSYDDMLQYNDVEILINKIKQYINNCSKDSKFIHFYLWDAADASQKQIKKSSTTTLNTSNHLNVGTIPNNNNNNNNNNDDANYNALIDVFSKQNMNNNNNNTKRNGRKRSFQQMQNNGDNDEPAHKRIKLDNGALFPSMTLPDLKEFELSPEETKDLWKTANDKQLKKLFNKTKIIEKKNAKWLIAQIKDNNHGSTLIKIDNIKSKTLLERTDHTHDGVIQQSVQTKSNDIKSIEIKQNGNISDPKPDVDVNNDNDDNKKGINIETKTLPAWWLHQLAPLLNKDILKLSLYKFCFIFESSPDYIDFSVPIRQMICGEELIFHDSELCLIALCRNDIQIYTGNVVLNVVSGRIYEFSSGSLQNNITVVNGKEKCYIILLRKTPCLYDADKANDIVMMNTSENDNNDDEEQEDDIDIQYINKPKTKTRTNKRTKRMNKINKMNKKIKIKILKSHQATDKEISYKLYRDKSGLHSITMNNRMVSIDNQIEKIIHGHNQKEDDKNDIISKIVIKYSLNVYNDLIVNNAFSEYKKELEPRLLFQIGNNYERLNDYNNASLYYEKAIKSTNKTNESSKFYHHYAICRRLCGNAYDDNFINKLFIKSWQLAELQKYSSLRKYWVTTNRLTEELYYGAKSAYALGRDITDIVDNYSSLLWYRRSINLLEQSQLIILQDCCMNGVIDPCNFQSNKSKKNGITLRKRINEAEENQQYIGFIEDCLQNYQECLTNKFLANRFNENDRNCTDNYHIEYGYKYGNDIIEYCDNDDNNNNNNISIESQSCFLTYNLWKNDFNSFSDYLEKELILIVDILNYHYNKNEAACKPIQIADFYINYGSYLLDFRSSYEKAIEIFYEAINYNSTDYNIYWNLGESYQHLNQFDDAAKNFQICLSMTPKEEKNNMKIDVDKIIKSMNEAKNKKRRK